MVSYTERWSEESADARRFAESLRLQDVGVPESITDSYRSGELGIIRGFAEISRESVAIDFADGSYEVARPSELLRIIAYHDPQTRG